jgi:hypothetical protein
MDMNDKACLAPWTHTYLSPQTERRMCCASREPAQSFQQYIDTSSGSGEYDPQTLEQHWNSEHMKSVRQRMLAGETLPECEVCNNKLLNVHVYRDYFTQMFSHKWQEVLDSTAPDGSTTMRPISWDYRFSNLCNFKCRMCGDMLSSSWEAESRMQGTVNWMDPQNAWMQPKVRKKIAEFQEDQVEREFAEAVEQHRVEEVYWVGGEPLMYEQHWRYMKRIIELGDGPSLYARYNTNLSRTEYRGINLYSDILRHVKDWQICASLDGTGAIGEYIRTGLDYEQWVENFRAGLGIQTHRRQMRIDFTLTLPGMFELYNIKRLAQQLDVDIMAKVIFSFSPEIPMSPLVLPKSLLDPWLDECIAECSDCPPLLEVLRQLRTRPTFQEQYPEQYVMGLMAGKQRIQHMERIRKAKTSMSEILSARPAVHAWWESIDA